MYFDKEKPHNVAFYLGQHCLLSNSYTMGCPPVGGDNPQALVSGLSDAQVDKTWYNYFIPPTSV